MQSTLAIITLAAGLLGLLYTWYARRVTSGESGWQFILREGLTAGPLFGAGATLAAFLFALPAFPPFSPGLGIGWGILIGGLCALLALGESAASESDEAWTGRRVGLLSLAAVGPSLILLLFRGNPVSALSGFALGSSIMVFCISGVVSAGLQDVPGRLRRGLEGYLLASTGVAATTLLAIERFPRATPSGVAGGYWTTPGLLLMVGALVLVLIPAAKNSDRLPGRILVRSVAVTLTAGLAAFLLHLKLLPVLSWLPFAYAIAGIGLVCWWFMQDIGRRPVFPALAAVLAALLVGALSWQASTGYGMGLAVIAAAILAVVLGDLKVNAKSSHAGALATGGTMILLLMVLSRLYALNTTRWRALDFQQHYQFLAVALGVGAVFAALTLASPNAKSSLSNQVWRTAGLGFAAFAAPLLLAVLWGDRAVSAYLGGLMISEFVWVMLGAWSTGDERESVLNAPPHAFLVSSALTAVFLTQAFIQYELTRVQKIEIIAGLAVFTVIAYVYSVTRRFEDETPE